MKLLAVGLNHQTAPIEVRERLATKFSHIESVYEDLKRISTEATILSTCNRVELYVVPSVSPNAIVDWMAQSGMAGFQSVRNHLYIHKEKEALKHIFRVISSLDSMILGEDQIVSQVKTAYRTAATSHSTGPVLNRVWEKALSVAKKVRTETAISQEGVSIGRAGVQLASHILGNLIGKKVLLIGAGQHGKLVAKHLSNHKLGALFIANRSFGRAEQLAHDLNAEAIPLSQAAHYLEHVDIVLTSVGGSRPLISFHEMQQILKARRYRPLICIDLSVPRAIDPSVAELPEVFCFDIDDLSQVANEGKEKRLIEAKKAEAIVLEESERCWDVLHADELNERIGNVFKNASNIQTAELERLFSSHTHFDSEQRDAIERYTQALVKKLLHHPIQTARKHAHTGDVAQFEHIINALTAPQKIEKK